MKNLIIAAGLLALASCKKSENVSETQQTDTLSSVKADTVAADNSWVSKNQAFLDKFRLIEPDYSMFAPPNDQEPMIGPALAKEELKLFPKTLNLESFMGSPEQFQEQFQAYVKFDIDSNTIGLVSRMPGEYVFSALNLFFYDKNKEAILPQYIELADEMGDAGYSEKTKSWIFKEASKIKSFTYKWTKIEPVDPDDQTRPSRTDDFYLITLNPQKIDTARVSKEDLPKYQKYLNQK